MTINKNLEDGFIGFIEDHPEILIQFFNNTIDTLRNIDYVFSKYPTSSLVNALNNSPVLTLEDYQPIYVTEGICGNVDRGLISDKKRDYRTTLMCVLTSRFKWYLKFRFFNNKAYPISVPGTDFPLKIQEDIENPEKMKNHPAGGLMSPEIISAVKQYTWHSTLAQHKGYDLAMYDPRSPYGRARLKFIKEIIPELIKIRDFLKEYLKKSVSETLISETPLSETVVFTAQ